MCGCVYIMVEKVFKIEKTFSWTAIRQKSRESLYIYIYCSYCFVVFTITCEISFSNLA